MSNRIYLLYQELYKKYGDPVKIWPQWCSKKKDNRLRDLITIGAVLTQRTNWHNADIALRNLKRKKFLSLKRISELKSFNELTELIRPAGFWQTKPRRLFGLASFVIEKYGDLERMRKEDLSSLRKKLVSLYGIGPETADVILLYALDKPSFVIDEYTRRLVLKRKLFEKTAYDSLKKLFENSLPRDAAIYQNYHALIIVDQKGKKDTKMSVI